MPSPEPLRVLIADDEPLAREKLRELLREAPEVEAVAEAATGDEAVEAIRGLAPDVVLLDVEMPCGDGFSVIEAVGPERMPVTIFVTAYDQFALRAFEVHALDYLLKPFDAPRFHLALERARKRIHRERATGWAPHLAALVERLQSRGQYPARFMVKSGARYVYLGADEIDRVEAAGNYVTLHAGGRSFLVRETMSAMEQKLDPDRFLRVRSSAIVNLDRVEAIEPWSSTEFLIRLRGGSRLRSSRGYRDRIRALLLR